MQDNLFELVGKKEGEKWEEVDPFSGKNIKKKMSISCRATVRESILQQEIKKLQDKGYKVSVKKVKGTSTQAKDRRRVYPYKGHFITIEGETSADTRVTVGGGHFEGKVYASMEQAKKEIDRRRKELKTKDGSENYSQTFLSESKAKLFINQLKNNGLKGEMSTISDPLNKGERQWIVKWDTSKKTKDVKSKDKYLDNILKAVSEQCKLSKDQIEMTPAKGNISEFFDKKTGKLIASYNNTSGKLKVNDGIQGLVDHLAYKNGYQLSIINKGQGNRIVLAFPGESISNPHMWLGEPTPENIKKAKKVFNDLVNGKTKAKDDYFYYEGDYKAKGLNAEQLLKEAERLLGIAKKHDGKSDSTSFGFISGDIYRLYLSGQTEFAKDPKANAIGKKVLQLSKEADKISKKNKSSSKAKDADKYVVKHKKSGQYLGRGTGLGSLSEAQRFDTEAKAWNDVEDKFEKPTDFVVVRLQEDAKTKDGEHDRKKIIKKMGYKGHQIQEVLLNDGTTEFWVYTDGDLDWEAGNLKEAKDFIDSY